MGLKFGKLPPVIDKRTIPLSKILRVRFLPALPLSYDIDESLGGIQDNFVFNNSQFGDCVIAARAHQTLRFEEFEQGIQIPITDDEVVNEYFKESGGRDTGLVLLSSLKAWRKNGWKIGDKNYTIYAFASVNWGDHKEVKHCIHLLGGVNFGMQVFTEDIRQFQAGEGWHLTGQNGYFEGGHGVYSCAYRDIGNGIKSTQYLEDCKVVSYNQDGVWIMTWGKRQFATWDFWDARVDECYAIVDNRDSWLGNNSPVDLAKLDGYLHEITGQITDEPGGCIFPFIGNLVKKVRNVRTKAISKQSRI